MQARTHSECDPYQLHLPIFPTHVIDAADREAERRWLKKVNGRLSRTEKENRKLATPSKEAIDRHHHISDLFDQIPDDALSAPLLGSIEGNELNATGVEATVQLPETALCGLEKVTWTDSEIDDLHEGILHYSLRLLQSKGNEKEKKEVLRWIFAPEAKVATLNDIHGKSVEVLLPQYATPFSFEMCCALCNYNPEKVQDELSAILDALDIENLFKEISNGTKQTRTSKVQRT